MSSDTLSDSETSSGDPSPEDQACQQDIPHAVDGADVAVSTPQLTTELAEPSAEKQSGGQRRTDEVFAQFLHDIDSSDGAEAKLKAAIEFMTDSLAQSGSPRFKHFWEARRVCLPLFKANVNPLLRAELWRRYTELSQEAKRLKDILDEQSAFAVEQIEIAISALETDLAAFDDGVGKVADIEFSLPSATLMKRYEFYNGIQKELSLLNTYAVRVSSLRKELVKTEMRVRHKNKFFRRLSAIGDQVFPRRKERIGALSEAFIADVDLFLTNDCAGAPSHEIREEIKGLQSAAKVLTLNTRAFTATRANLSQCWDQVKEEDKGRKKERSERRHLLKGNAEAIGVTIDEFCKQYDAGTLAIGEAHAALDEITKTVRDTELLHADVKDLKDRLGQARGLVEATVNAERQARADQDRAKEEEKQRKITSLKERLASLAANSADLSVEMLTEEKTKLEEETALLTRSKAERLEFDRLLKTVRDAVSDKKEQALLSLPADDREALEQLRELLRQRRGRRQEVKDNLEQLRKVGGSSGLDFDQAMTNRQLIVEERERLEKTDAGISEIEGRITALKNSCQPGVQQDSS